MNYNMYCTYTRTVQCPYSIAHSRTTLFRLIVSLKGLDSLYSKILLYSALSGLSLGLEQNALLYAKCCFGRSNNCTKIYKGSIDGPCLRSKPSISQNTIRRMCSYQP